MILTIFIVGLFALDSFSDGNSFWQNVGSFLINLIPAYILIVILVIAWNWEKTGGIIIMVLGLVSSVLVFNMNFRRNHSVLDSLVVVLIICMPSLIAGILFFISSRKTEIRRPE
jgi:phosphoglycerol transferase MdoB-like AlkP superfamily enzyme